MWRKPSLWAKLGFSVLTVLSLESDPIGRSFYPWLTHRESSQDLAGGGVLGGSEKGSGREAWEVSEASPIHSSCSLTHGCFSQGLGRVGRLVESGTWPHHPWAPARSWGTIMEVKSYGRSATW